MAKKYYCITSTQEFYLTHDIEEVIKRNFPKLTNEEFDTLIKYIEGPVGLQTGFIELDTQNLIEENQDDTELDEYFENGQLTQSISDAISEHLGFYYPDKYGEN